MKILVYPHELKIGGSAINAIDLATKVRDLGHEVVIFGSPGQLCNIINARAIKLITYDAPRRPRPSLAIMRALREVARGERFDLVHAYEAYPSLEAFYALHFGMRMPVVSTILSMHVEPWLPKSMPLIVGTAALQKTTTHRSPITLIEPPIDTTADHLSAVDPEQFCRTYGLDNRCMTIVIVSRFVASLKLEGLERLISAMEHIAADIPTRLVMVGYGPYFDHLQHLADAANERLKRNAIILTGSMLDPRPAYAAADLVVGMGSSVLRGMSFAKPTVVVGEGGFSLPVTPATIGRFLDKGFYGVGDGDTNPARLAGHITDMLKLPSERRAALGEFSRSIVVDRFSLDAAAQRLVGVYESVAQSSFRSHAVFAEGLESTFRMLWTGKMLPRLKRYVAAR